tara:strand:- start:220 stop:504 length:285 start_codon:yes stop_codon:yes gene_type:complete
MARPKAPLICKIPDATGWAHYEMLESNKIWIIMHNNIAVRAVKEFTDPTMYYLKKYIPTIYHNKAHAKTRLKNIIKLTKDDGFWLKEIDFLEKQ